MMRIQDEDWKAWAHIFETADKIEQGRWTVWIMNILCRLCDVCNCPGRPEDLPTDARTLRAAVEEVLNGKGPQQQCRAIRMMRVLLASDEKHRELLDVFPRHRRREPMNRITRQRRMVLEDALPKRDMRPWVQELFREILEHEASSHWRTSKTANQNFNLIHKFMRTSGLLDFDSLDDFHRHRMTLDKVSITDMCHRFADAFCATPASARRYLVVFNHLFHKVWKMVPQKVDMPVRRRPIRSLAEMDETLSQTSKSSTGQKNSHPSQQDYFDETELEEIRSAASIGATRIIDSLIVSLLETTGLRRTGILNILVREIAEQENDTGLGFFSEHRKETHTCRWVAFSTSRTLTKGLVTHPFKLQTTLRHHVQAWLNTPEQEGGRPRGPSPFLLPSAHTDDGQMSPATLSRMFTAICNRTSLRGDRRVHLHAMRHSAAHSLARKGNQAKQISVFLGHKSVNVTNDVYLRDTADKICEGMVLPEQWNGETSAHAAAENVTAVCPDLAKEAEVITNKKKKKEKSGPSTKELMQRAIEMLSRV